MMPLMQSLRGSKHHSVFDLPAIGLRALQTWPWLATARTLLVRFREDRLGQTAGSLTFTTLISLVPLFTVMLALFTAFPIFASFQDALQRYFLKTLVPDTIAKPVLGALTQFASKANSLGTVGLVLLLVSALAVMLTIDRTLNNIWRVRRVRPFAQRVLVYWAALTLGPVLLGLSLSLTSYAISASQGLVSVVPDVVRWMFSLLEFALLALAVTGLFRFVPNLPVQWAHAAAGGLFVALAFEACKKVLAWYLHQVPTYSMVYGAFATVPIFLIWIYLCWVIVLLGAVIAAYAPSLRLGLGRWSEGPGARLGLALAVLDRLETARAEPPFGLTVAELSYRLRCDPLQVESVFESLESLGWVGRLDDAGPQRHILLCDPQKTLAAPLLAMLMLERTDATDVLWREAELDRVMLSALMDTGLPTSVIQPAALATQPS